MTRLEQILLERDTLTTQLIDALKSNAETVEGIKATLAARNTELANLMLLDVCYSARTVLPEETK